jgi:hypothetical protein
MPETNVPSIPLILFTIADAIARSGLPEPISVEVETERLFISTHTRGDLDAWCDHFGIGHGDWERHSQAHDRRGVPHTLSSAFGRWQDVRIKVQCLVPVPPAEVPADLVPTEREIAERLYGPGWRDDVTGLISGPIIEDGAL